ncbi:MAG: sporulation protein YqfD, partial [Oscillospiraceae bacterium]|nr:sporulation protein YqfD [Oscillospiraceae bacterium]
DILCESFPWEERAEAVVKARTWRELSASMPLDCIKKSYTGAEKRRETLVFGEKRINFYLTGGNPYMNCDKITESRRLRISENGLLPLSLCAVELYEWTPSAGTLSEAEAEAILKARLISRLNGDIGAGSVTSTEFSKTVENGVLTLTLSAECLEEISG